MTVWWALAAAAVLQAPQVELLTLSDQTHTGVLTQLSESGAVLATGDREVSVSAADLLEIRFPTRKPQPRSGKRVQLTLTDGSTIFCSAVSTSPRQATLEVPGVGNVEIPGRTLANVRFQPLKPALRESWKELIERDSKSDLLVIHKDDVLDFLPGVIGKIDSQSVEFLLDGDQRTVARKKVFGLIYHHRNSRRTPKSVCSISLADGSLLNARRVELEDGVLTAKLSAGGNIKLPTAEVLSMDFSGGKVVYLSSIEPRTEKYEPFFEGDDVRWGYRRDRTESLGKPIKLFGKTYRRGLWIHSKMTLTYRLKGDFRRFRAVMGIDEMVRPLGNVNVIIRGDGRVLYPPDQSGETDPKGAKVTGQDAEPHRLDLDVTGVRDLEILVDFGDDEWDGSDHLDLADARVIK